MKDAAEALYQKVLARGETQLLPEELAQKCGTGEWYGPPHTTGAAESVAPVAAQSKQSERDNQ